MKNELRIPATMRVVPQYLQDRLLEKQWRARVWLNRERKQALPERPF